MNRSEITQKLTLLLAIVLAGLILGGCVTTGTVPSAVLMCGMKPVGQNDSGVVFVLMQCEEHKQ